MAQKIRHEIVLTNATSTASSSNQVQLFTGDYTDATYYFEVVGRVTSGTMTVSLRRFGTTTDDATLTFTETANTRKRTAAFSPPTIGSTTYFLFISGGTGPVVNTGRIVIIQNSTTTISKTRPSFEIGNQELTKTNTTLAPLSFPKYWKYTAANWNTGVPTFIARVVWQHSSSMSNATVVLQEDDGSFASWTTKVTIVNAATGGGGVTISEIAFTPTDGRNYRISARCASATYNYSIYSAKILVKIDTTNSVSAVTKVSSSDPSIGAGYAGITKLTSTRIATFECNVTKQLKAFDWNGTSWVLVGNALTISTSTSALFGFCTLTSNTIAIIERGTKELRTYSFDGTNWAQVGSGLSIANIDNCTMQALDSTTVMLAEGYNLLQIRTYSWSGSSWSQVGSGLTIPSGNTWSAPLSSTKVALYNTGNGLATYAWSGSAWTLDSSVSSPAVGGTNWVMGISATKVVLIPNTTNTFYFYDLIGTSWTLTSSIAYGSGLVNTATAYIGGGLFAFDPISSVELLQMGQITFVAAQDLKIEAELLMLNTADIGTGLQGRQTLYDSTEWDDGAGTLSFYHSMDSDNASNSSKLTVPPSTDIASSTITGINTQTSAALTLTTGTNIDTNVINTTGSINASRIKAVYVYSSAPSRIPIGPGTIGHPFIF